MKKAAPIVKATVSGTVNATGNAGGQVLSGKDLKEVNWPAVAWSGVASSMGSYMGRMSNVDQELIGKTSMLIPEVSGLFMLNEAEKNLKDNK